jgi:peptidoglycan/LPS O-acetylase OafA/YrhL
MSAGRRNFGLDMLRAAAILGVFVDHELHVIIAGKDFGTNLGCGVELFFVLSGFLIGGICFRSFQRQDFSFWNFWRSRWWRTLPPYLAAVLFYMVIRQFHTSFPPLPLYYWFFLQNYLGLIGFGPTWSLCVEEHFYLSLPVVVFMVARFAGLRALRYLLPVLFFVPLVLRLGTYWIHGGQTKMWAWNTHLHFEGLIAGVWLSYLLVFDRPAFDGLKRPFRWLLPLPIGMILFLTYFSNVPSPAAIFFIDIFRWTVFALGFAACLRLSYDLSWEPVSRAGKFVRWCVVGMALCSYSVYLTHDIVSPPLRMLINRVMLTRGVIRTLITLPAIWMLGVVFYLLVERPTIITRDRYLKRTKAHPVVQAPLRQAADTAQTAG